MIRSFISKSFSSTIDRTYNHADLWKRHIPGRMPTVFATTSESTSSPSSLLTVNKQRNVVAPLADKAMTIATKIGVVEVDMGDTDCKVPEAASYVIGAAEHFASFRDPRSSFVPANRLTTRSIFRLQPMPFRPTPA